jgi:hypothetical protein
MPPAPSLGPLLAIAALAVASCSKPAPTPTGRPQLQAGGVAWQILGGTWTKDGDALVGTGGHIQTVADFTDGTAELTVEQTEPSEQTIGIGFRYSFANNDPTHSTGYALHFSKRGFNVFRGANNYWQPVNPELRGFVPSSTIEPTRNRFVLRLSGGTFQIDANGASLFMFTDTTHPHGHIDLWVESPTQKVRFSNIRLSP